MTLVLGLRGLCGPGLGAATLTGCLVVLLVLLLALVAGRWWERRERERARAHHEAWLRRTTPRE